MCGFIIPPMSRQMSNPSTLLPAMVEAFAEMTDDFKPTFRIAFDPIVNVASTVVLHFYKEGKNFESRHYHVPPPTRALRYREAASCSSSSSSSSRATFGSSLSKDSLYDDWDRSERIVCVPAPDAVHDFVIGFVVHYPCDDDGTVKPIEVCLGSTDSDRLCRSWGMLYWAVVHHYEDIKKLLISLFGSDAASIILGFDPLKGVGRCLPLPMKLVSTMITSSERGEDDLQGQVGQPSTQLL